MVAPTAAARYGQTGETARAVLSDRLYRVHTTEALMKSILLTCPMIMFTLAAAAQSVPSMPKLPTDDKPSVTVTSGKATSGTSIPGAGQTSNPIDKIKTEAECKIPTNAAKPECIELMLKK
jgi:hypothetical protein